MSDTWQLTTMNVNGLRAATRKGFVDWRDKLKTDALLLQELRMQTDQFRPEHAPPPGWGGIRSQAVKKGYSGVSCWTRLAVRSATVDPGISLAVHEGRWAQVETSEASLVSLYVPSGTSGEERQRTKDTFSDDLMDVFDRLAANDGLAAVCGDINIAHTERDIHAPRRNSKNSGFLPHERAWMTRLLDRGWVDLWRHMNPDAQEYTWWSNRGQARAKDRGWRIDYVLVTPALAERATACWIEGREPALSDHCATHATFQRS